MSFWNGNILTWTYLGGATSTATSVGPVQWSDPYQFLMVRYFSAGANGGTTIPRILFGIASGPSTTALNNGSTVHELSSSDSATVPVVSSSCPSIPGIPVAVTQANIERAGVVYVDGASGALKNISLLGQSGTAAVATPPKLIRAEGVFSDLSSNLFIQRVQFTLYDSLAATAASSQTFNTGSRIDVWGA